MKFTHILKFVFLAAVLVLAGCESSVEPEDPGPGEEEVITTVNFTLTEVGNTSNVVTAQWRDLDGEGGSDPVISGFTLEAGKTYTGAIELLNEEENEDITEEVEEEADEHQFFYTPDAAIASRVTVTITDTDGNNLPVGLEYTVTVSAGAAVTGSINVVLGHYDDAPKDGTTRSDESDIDIDIPITIN